MNLHYQQEACKVVQATFILFILSLIEEGIFTQLQGEGSRRTVNSLQLRSRLNEKVKRTLEDGEFILCEKNSPGEYEKDNRSTLVLQLVLTISKRIADTLEDHELFSKILRANFRYHIFRVGLNTSMHFNSRGQKRTNS